MRLPPILGAAALAAVVGALAWLMWKTAIEPAASGAGPAASARPNAGGDRTDPEAVRRGLMPAGTDQSSARDVDKPVMPSPTRAMPRPLSARNAQRVAAFAEHLAGLDAHQQDLLMLARQEKPDPRWSPQMEAALETTLLGASASIAAMEVGQVHCSRSVCMLSATGGGYGQTPGTDWQGAMSRAMNEPWFRANFDDTSSTMHDDGQGLVHVTYFIRK